MSQPIKYQPSNDFTEDNTGALINAELNSISNVLSTIISNVGLLQRDDTKLGNSTVHSRALSPEVLSLLATAINPVGNWATATDYKKADSVENSNIAYLCVIDHTSAADFNTDRTAGRWIRITNDALMGTLSNLSENDILAYDSALQYFINKPSSDFIISTYDTWLSQGNSGTEQDFLDSLKATVDISGKEDRHIFALPDWVNSEDETQPPDEMSFIHNKKNGSLLSNGAAIHIGNGVYPYAVGKDIESVEILLACDTVEDDSANNKKDIRLQFEADGAQIGSDKLEADVVMDAGTGHTTITITGSPIIAASLLATQKYGNIIVAIEEATTTANDRVGKFHIARVKVIYAS